MFLHCGYCKIIMGILFIVKPQLIHNVEQSEIAIEKAIELTKLYKKRVDHDKQWKVILQTDKESWIYKSISKSLNANGT